MIKFMNIKAIWLNIINLLSYVKWDNILSVLFGALVSGFISYNFLKRREKYKLRQDLQIKVTEQILEDIKTVNEKAAMLFIPDFSSFKGYNSTLEYIEKNMLTELNSNQLQWSKDRISKNMDKFFDIWNEYSSSFSRFSISFENKQIILNKFIGINELLGEELMKMLTIEDEIMHLYHFDISDYVTYSNPISVDLINKMEELHNEFQEKKAYIISVFYDLKIELQNEYLGELFEFKIPERCPKDKDKYPVYKAGYIHTYNEDY